MSQFVPGTKVMFRGHEATVVGREIGSNGYYILIGWAKIPGCVFWKISSRAPMCAPGHLDLNDFAYGWWASPMELTVSHKVQTKDYTDPEVEKAINAIRCPPKGPDLSDWRVWRHNVPGECCCGIPKDRCDYHR